MCFTPQVSFLIFTIEWILGFIVLHKAGKARERRVYSLSALILFLLGFYQFTQFMLCVSGKADLWGRMGFLAYNFLPLLGFHLAAALTRNRQYLEKVKYYYIIPAFFSLFPLLSPGFIGKAECSAVFIVVEHSWNALWAWSYAVYYFLFIVLAALMLWNAVKAEKSKGRRRVMAAGLSGMLAFTVPAFILIIILPALKIAFPSILCEFALFFAISVFWMMHLMEESGHK